MTINEYEREKDNARLIRCKILGVVLSIIIGSIFLGRMFVMVVELTVNPLEFIRSSHSIAGETILLLFGYPSSPIIRIALTIICYTLPFVLAWMPFFAARNHIARKRMQKKPLHRKEKHDE